MVNCTCKFCGTEFSAKSKNKKYCSERCRYEARPKLPCCECGGPTGYYPSKKIENPTCNECRTSKHGTVTRYRSGCRCEECREANNASYRKWRKNARDRGWEPATRKAKRLTCDWCGKVIKSRANAADGLVLCKPHRDEKTTEDKLRSARAMSRRKRFGSMITKAAAGTRSNQIWVQGPCLVCREPFMSAGKDSRYCSRECRKISVTRSNWISYQDRLSIYIRDGWTCQICDEKTSREFNPEDPCSPTLDHIKPKSQGGSDDPENLRLTHLWCNSMRGDGAYSDAEVRELRFLRKPVGGGLSV